MRYNVHDATFVHVWRGVRCMTNNQRFRLAMHKFSSGAAIFKHLVTQMFKQSFQLIPLDVSCWRLGS